jgi:hypothetical protein
VVAINRVYGSSCGAARVLDHARDIGQKVFTAARRLGTFCAETWIFAKGHNRTP